MNNPTSLPTNFSPLFCIAQRLWRIPNSGYLPGFQPVIGCRFGVGGIKNFTCCPSFKLSWPLVLSWGGVLNMETWVTINCCHYILPWLKVSIMIIPLIPYLPLIGISNNSDVGIWFGVKFWTPITSSTKVGALIGLDMIGIKSILVCTSSLACNTSSTLTWSRVTHSMLSSLLMLPWLLGASPSGHHSLLAPPLHLVMRWLLEPKLEL